MLSDIGVTCDATGCERELVDADCQLILQTSGGERRAYECACGAVTITLAGTAVEDPPIRP
jgi:hypothetical protein